MNNILTFDLARNALRYLVKTYDIKEMLIPYYLCDVIRHTLIEENCRPLFYHIDDKFYPDINFDKNDYILYPNYFGICKANIDRLTQIYPHLIVDNAHAYFDNPTGFACFNAGHKFGFKESYLWINNYNVEKSEILIDTRKDSKETRVQKFIELHAKYFYTNQLKIDTTAITAPFVYPYLAKTVEEADDLVKKLTQSDKTIYRYWNPLPKSFNEYKFYSRLVPIPL